MHKRSTFRKPVLIHLNRKPCGLDTDAQTAKICNQHPMFVACILGGLPGQNLYRYFK